MDYMNIGDRLYFFHLKCYIGYFVVYGEYDLLNSGCDLYEYIVNTSVSSDIDNMYIGVLVFIESMKDSAGFSESMDKLRFSGAVKKWANDINTRLESRNHDYQKARKYEDRFK